MTSDTSCTPSLLVPALFASCLTQLLNNPLETSPLAFKASPLKQKHSRSKSRQLRKLKHLALQTKLVKPAQKCSYDLF